MEVAYLRQVKRDRSRGTPAASALDAKLRAYKAARQGTEPSPPAQIANFWRCSIFNIELTLICFLPVFSSRSVILWMFDSLIVFFAISPLFCFFLPIWRANSVFLRNRESINWNAWFNTVNHLGVNESNIKENKGSVFRIWTQVRL